jgi:hypothetical protein
MSRESEITTYYFLYSNLQHKFIQHLHYDQVWSFLVQMLCQMNPNKPDHVTHRRLLLIDQCWNFFGAAGFFGDLAMYCLNRSVDLDHKANAMYKTTAMVRYLIEPDQTLDETLTLNLKERMNFITEEVYNYTADIDVVRPLISKRYVKALSYFAKYMMPNSKLKP